MAVIVQSNHIKKFNLPLTIVQIWKRTSWNKFKTNLIIQIEPVSVTVVLQKELSHRVICESCRSESSSDSNDSRIIKFEQNIDDPNKLIHWKHQTLPQSLNYLHIPNQEEHLWQFLAFFLHRQSTGHISTEYFPVIFLTIHHHSDTKIHQF